MIGWLVWARHWVSSHQWTRMVAKWIVASPWQFLSRNSQALLVKWKNPSACRSYLALFLFEDYIRSINFFLGGGVGMTCSTNLRALICNYFFRRQSGQVVVWKGGNPHNKNIQGSTWDEGNYRTPGSIFRYILIHNKDHGMPIWPPVRCAANVGPEFLIWYVGCFCKISGNTVDGSEILHQLIWKISPYF